MSITVKRFRMSLFWSVSFATLFDDACAVRAPLAALGDIDSYAQIFSTLLGTQGMPMALSAGTPELELPWPSKGTHTFWCHYLKSYPPIRRIPGKLAFVRLVPLRRHASPVHGMGVRLPLTLTSAGKVVIEHVLGEAWYHPHMATFAVHFTVNGEFTPMEMSELCLELRRGRVLSEPGDSDLHGVDEVAGKYLDMLFQEAVGVENAGQLPFAKPFSIVTILHGNADTLQVIDGGPVHRALEVVTQWNAQKLGALDAGRISCRQPGIPDAPILFGHARSRAVWDPQRFSTIGGVSLSCYHRNLFVGALQTEALLSFAKIAEAYVAGKEPKAIHDCWCSVVQHIFALHQGGNTYRSASIRRFIDDHDFRSSVDVLAQRTGCAAKLPPI